MIIEGPHFQECIEDNEVQASMLAEFLARYPNYCRACHAYGYKLEQDYWGEWEWKGCEGCDGLCPRCMTATLADKEDNQECSTCGWIDDLDFAGENCLPRSPECFCADMRRDQEWELS